MCTDACSFMQGIAIDLMQLMSSPHVTKRETDGGRKSGYYDAILSGKNDCGLWSLSTAEQFASSFLASAGSDFTFKPRMHKVSTGHFSLLPCGLGTRLQQDLTLTIAN